VRVIAGEAYGESAVIETHTPILFHDWTLQPGAQASQPLPADHDGLVYVFAGAAEVDGTRVGDGQLARLGAGDLLRLACPADANHPRPLPPARRRAAARAGRPATDPLS
jgi:redox-sensitive bicupin YhaK (pirin superfamily)